MPIRKLSFIGRTYRHARRYRQILAVLLKWGFNDLVDGLRVEQYLELGLRRLVPRRPPKVEGMSRAERLCRVFEELGPTFIKLGQILSTRPDLVPGALLAELPKLQDRVQAFPFADVQRIVERELSAPLAVLFHHFAEDPLAAASIGQVHRAEIEPGEQVVVKVQRPGIRRTVEVDIEIMLHLATLMERHLEGWAIHQPTRIVEEFAHTLMRELDYAVEAANLERFAWHFASERRVRVPAVYREATTSRVLTLEYVPGIKASDVAGLLAAGLNPQEVARRCAQLTMQQIFLDGFFHADPHPGNVFLLPDNVVCYLDFGMVGRIDRHVRESFADLLTGIVARDESAVAQALLELAIWEDPPESRVLTRDVGEFIDQHFYRPLRELHVGKLLQQLFELAARHQLRISPELFLAIKALSSVEGLCRQLDPNFEIVVEAAPFVARVQRERLHPRRFFSGFLASSSDLFRLLRVIPSEVQGILRQLREGKTRLGFDLLGLEAVSSALDRASNRLAFAIVLAALIIGSSLIVLASLPPLWHGIPTIGLGGFVVAAIMGFWLLASILKHGRM